MQQVGLHQLFNTLLTLPFFSETGIKMKLHTRSHGILATVRGGGHIEHIAPLFKSESPTQVDLTPCKTEKHNSQPGGNDFNPVSQ